MKQKDFLIYNMVRSLMLGRKSNLVEKSAGKKQGSILDYRNTQNAI
jgi:hypothetical protein